MMEELIKSLTDAVQATQGICQHDNKKTLWDGDNDRTYVVCLDCDWHDEL